MKVGLIGLLSPFIALPMAYLPFRAMHVDKNMGKLHDNSIESKAVPLETIDFSIWTSEDDNETPKKVGQVYERLDFKQMLLGYFGSYMVYKLFTKIFRSLVLVSLVSTLL